MKTQNRDQNQTWYIFLPIFIGLGTGVGALLGNIGLGLAVGAAVGTTLNLIAYYGLINRSS